MLYHYTIADRLVKIYIDGFIKMSPHVDKLESTIDEIQCVWLTCKDTWDNTAFYGYPSAALDNAGRIRISIDKAYNKAVLHHERILDYDVLAFTAAEVGVDHLDWHISTKPIPVKFFHRVELWKDNKWVEIPIRRII